MTKQSVKADQATVAERGHGHQVNYPETKSQEYHRHQAKRRLYDTPDTCYFTTHRSFSQHALERTVRRHDEMDFFGTPHIVQFQYQVNDRGFVVATDTIHPATNPLDPDEPDTNVIFTKAKITTPVGASQTDAAMRQYVRQHLT